MDLEYHIKTTAELQGAESAVAQMENSIGKAKVLGESYADLEAKVTQGRAAIDEYKKSNTDLDDSVGKLARTSGDATLKHHLLREVFGELNRILPELGIVTHVFEEAIRRSGESSTTAANKTTALSGAIEGEAAAADAAAAETGVLAGALDTEAAAADTAAAANDSFIASTGPLAIVLLGIQALITAWDFYKEHVGAAQEADAAKAKSFDDLTRASIKVEGELTAALNKEADASDALTKKYDAEKTIREARLEQERELLRMKEAEDEAAAQTPEQKNAVKQKYAEINAALGDRGEQDDIAALQKLIADEGDSITENQSHRSTVKKEISMWEGRHRADDAAGISTKEDDEHIASLNKSLEKIDKEIGKLTDAQKANQDKLTEQTALAGIHSETRAAEVAEGQRTAANEDQTEKNKPIIRQVEKDDPNALDETTGAEAISDKVTAGKKTSADEQQYMMKLANVMTGHVNNLDQAAKYFQELEKSPAKFIEALQKLVAVNSSHTAVAEQQTTMIDALARRVDILSKKTSQAHAAMNNFQ